MYRATSEATPKLFADDTNLFIVDDNLGDLSTRTNKCLDEIYQWCLANKLTINLDKTNYTIFFPSRKTSVENFNINIGNFKIQYTTCCKYLGILIDNKLDWQDHIDFIYKKLLKFCGIFYKIRDLLPFQCLKMVYFSFVYTHLLYGIEIYANTCSTYLHRLNVLNNKLIRILFNKNKFTHVKDLYKCIDSLPIINLHDFTIIKFVHNCIFNPVVLPDIFSDYFLNSKLASNYNSRRQFDLFVHHFNTNTGRKCVKIKGCILWNKLPNNVKSIANRVSFCKALKLHLLGSELDL